MAKNKDLLIEEAEKIKAELDALKRKKKILDSASKKPKSSPAKKPAKKAKTEPAEKPAKKAKAEPTKKPKSSPAKKPAKKAKTEPAEKSTKKPKSEPAKKPAKKAKTEPAEKPAKTKKEPTKKPKSAPAKKPAKKTKTEPAKKSEKPAKKAKAEPAKKPKKAAKEKKLTKKELEEQKKEAEKTLEEELEEQLSDEEIENFQIEKVDMERLTNKVCDILAGHESEGMFQNDLWKKLKLTIRDGSRLALKLERMGTITREKILSKDRWTYKLILKKTPISTQSIENAPCLVCPVEQKCSLEGEISPRNCQFIEDWVIAEMKKPSRAK